MACIRLPHHRGDGYVHVRALMVGSARRLMVLAGIITLTILRRYLNNSAEDESPGESAKRFERQVTRALVASLLLWVHGKRPGANDVS